MPIPIRSAINVARKRVAIPFTSSALLLCAACSQEPTPRSVPDAGTDAAHTLRTDDDPVENAPPPILELTHAGWGVRVGSTFDAATNHAGEVCDQRALEYVTSGEAYVGGLNVIHDSVDDVLETMGLPPSWARDANVVDMGRLPEVETFAERIKGGERTLLGLSSPNIASGLLRIDSTTEGSFTCTEPFVARARLEVRFATGLRMTFKRAEDRDAFFADQRFQRVFWSSDPSEGEQGLDLEDVEDWLEGKVERVEVVVAQFTTKPRDLTALLRDARCSERELEGCRELLAALGRTRAEFLDNLETPTPTDFGGWAPMTLMLRTP